jgi:GH15 family glucan-1,4-alpha-glucosidase
MRKPRRIVLKRPPVKPIGDYGLIGNLHTAALVGLDGSIEWFCLPHFDSPSLFAAILDRRKGGYFQIAPTADGSPKQSYMPDSNVLVSRFLSPQGVGEVCDFMPVETDECDEASDHRLYRIVRAVRGAVEFEIACVPAFNYARTAHTVQKISKGYLFKTRDLEVALHAPMRLTVRDGGVYGRFTLKAGESTTFVLRHVEDHEKESSAPLPEDPEQILRDTLAYWQRWVGGIQYQGRWREVMRRSALVLKMMVFAPTGALVAAPTCSLPESIGGRRNWDYRFTWIRDASFTLYALLRLGFPHEAGAFMHWLEDRMKEVPNKGSLQILYGLHGEKEVPEVELKHLEGYLGSRPIRIGNAASDQNQLDIYGELMDSVYLYDKYGAPISYDLWTHLSSMLDYVCRHWKEKDKGIWEVRSGAQHFVYSKVMCWVALDRGIRLARKRSFPGNVSHWIKIRDQIYRTVMSRGWNSRLQSFTQYFGSQTLDASALLFPLVKFISPTDPRMLSTLDAIYKHLVRDHLVHRYEVGRGVGTPEGEGTFSMCTFWYVEALARAGRLEEARWAFEKMLSYANHLGLFAEEIGLRGEQLGNFPQAFTHLGLISAAYNLNVALDKVHQR